MSAHRQLLDHPIIGERYFYPRPDRVEDAEVISGLRCFRQRPAEPAPGAPILLHFHGNGEVVADWAADLAPELAGRGLEVVLAEYRGYGGSEGSPALGSMLDDAVAVARAAGPAERLIVYGRSVGSIYALHVAAELPVAGLVIESGVAEVGHRLALRLDAGELGVTDAELATAVAAELDHRDKLERFDGPVVILHTAGDHLVDADNARCLAEWAGDRAELVLFDRGDHNSIWAYNGPEIIDRVVALAAACVSV